MGLPVGLSVLWLGLQVGKVSRWADGIYNASCSLIYGPIFGTYKEEIGGDSTKEYIQLTLIVFVIEPNFNFKRP